MSEKEPGQAACEAYWFAGAWEKADADERAAWVRVEAAVLEKAARIAESFNGSGACIGIADAIRAALKTGE